MPDETADYLLQQAKRCRRQADGTMDHPFADTLRGMAEEYEQKAAPKDATTGPQN